MFWLLTPCSLSQNSHVMLLWHVLSADLYKFSCPTWRGRPTPSSRTFQVWDSGRLQNSQDPSSETAPPESAPIKMICFKPHFLQLFFILFYFFFQNTCSALHVIWNEARPQRIHRCIFGILAKRMALDWNHMKYIGRWFSPKESSQGRILAFGKQPTCSPPGPGLPSSGFVYESWSSP